MKYSLFIMIIFLAIITGVKAKTNHTPEALVAMAKKLSSLKSISYQHHYEFNYPKDNYFTQATGSCYLEFDQTDNRSITRFRLDCDDYTIIYNGTELIDLNKKTKTYKLSTKPNQRSFASKTFFINSIQALRSVIQALIENDSIAMSQRDTLIQNKLYKLVQLNSNQKAVEYLGYFRKLDSGVVLYYQIVIDPATWLPYAIIQTNNVKPASTMKFLFTDINTQPKAPEANAWLYTTYQKDYQPEKKAERTPLIKAGTMMLPVWSLPEYNGKDDPEFKWSSVKGKLVLLDFWIKNCGPCMKSFPKLQELQKTYGGGKFELVSINTIDKKEDVAFFYNREKPLYKMLYNGANLAKGLGIDAYPIAILIDKTGKVIYAGEFNSDKIEALIKANL